MTRSSFTSYLAWVPFALLAILVGLYPLTYFLLDMKSHGLLSAKPKEVLNTPFYLLVFYIHISCGGLALLIGWAQFSERLRVKRMKLHRSIGKVYVLAVLFSSLAGLFIALFADGGMISVFGFGLLALCWLYTDVKGYMAIRQLNIPQHRRWMIRSYALAFAAVTLRIYLPLSTAVFHLPFLPAYRTISWLCWIPNLFIAEGLIRRAAIGPERPATANIL